MSAGDIDWTGWTDAYGWNSTPSSFAPFHYQNDQTLTQNTVTGTKPAWDERGSVTYCRLHPSEKIAEFASNSGWMKSCPICVTATMRAAMLRSQVS